MRAPNLCLFVDGNRNAILREVHIDVYRNPGLNPSKRFFRRGHLMLKFDQLVTVHSKKDRDEGNIQPGRGKQIAGMLMDGGVGIGAKDLTDGLSGVVDKSWYMIPISCVTLSFFSKGGDVNLKPGDKLEIESSKE